MRSIVFVFATVSLGCGLPAVSCGSDESDNSGRTPERAFATIGGDNYVPIYLRRSTPSVILAGDRIFCAFQDSKGRPVVMTYDVAQRVWAAPVTASDDGLGKDMHGSPSLCIDRDGFLHLFFGCHRGPLLHVRSRRPLDAAEWKKMPAPAASASYPETIRHADGSLRVYFRAGGHPEPWVVIASQDNGLTWSDPQRLIEMRIDPPRPKACAYARFFPGRDSTTIHCFFNYKEDNPDRWRKTYTGFTKAAYRYDMYYMRMNRDGAWTNATGHPLSLPLSRTEADEHCRFFESGDTFAYPGSYGVDQQDNPYLVFRTGATNWDKGGPDNVFQSLPHIMNQRTSTAVPIREYYCRFADNGWQFAESAPTTWPADVMQLLSTTAEAAYRHDTQGQLIEYTNPWFLSFTMDPGPTSLFLYNKQHGYAVQHDGPAQLQ